MCSFYTNKRGARTQGVLLGLCNRAHRGSLIYCIRIHTFKKLVFEINRKIKIKIFGLATLREREGKRAVFV
jgi:hypothetical protein